MTPGDSDIHSIDDFLTHAALRKALMTTTTTRIPTSGDRVRSHFANDTPESLIDDGVLPAEGWTVWIHRHRPHSDSWVLSFSPSVELRAAGQTDERTGAGFQTQVPFEFATFHSTRMDAETAEGHTLPDEFRAGIEGYLNHLLGIYDAIEEDDV